MEVSWKEGNNMPKAKRNKTIDTSIEDGMKYLSNCISLQEDEMIDDIKSVTDKTILGDAFSVLKLLPKNTIDLVIVDPPYNIDKKFGPNEFHKMSEEKYEEYVEDWILLLLPLMKESASIYVCCDWKSSLVIGRVLARHFYIQNRITWQREKGRGANTNWKNGMEDIWFATKHKTNYTFNLSDVKIRRKVLAPYKQDGKPKDWNETNNGKFRDTCPSNFWDDISVPYWSMPENTAHPTQKPEKLLAKLILASSNKGDIILDPFLGSGTTSVVSKKLYRHFIGIEYNPQYCIWTEMRLENAEKDKSIQGYIDKVFWERNTNAEQKRFR